jgi:hypothetical protein
MITDGGGKAAAALNVIAGSDHVARSAAGTARKGLADDLAVRPATINGLPGLILEGRAGVYLGRLLTHPHRRKTPFGTNPVTTCVRSTTSLTRKSTAMLASESASAGVSPFSCPRKSTTSQVA